MSPSIKSDIIKWKSEKTFEEYSILFLCDFYKRMEDITEQDFNLITQDLSVDMNYTVDSLIRTMLNTEYQHEKFMGEMNVEIFLKTYLAMNIITEVEYSDYIELLGTLSGGE